MSKPKAEGKTLEDRLLEQGNEALALPLSCMLLVCCEHEQGVLWLEHPRVARSESKAYEDALKIAPKASQSVDEKTLMWFKSMQLGLLQSAVPLMVLSDRVLLDSFAKTGRNWMHYEPSFLTLEQGTPADVHYKRVVLNVATKMAKKRQVRDQMLSDEGAREGVLIPSGAALQGSGVQCRKGIDVLQDILEEKKPIGQSVKDAASIQWHMVHALAPFCEVLCPQVENLVAKGSLVKNETPLDLTDFFITHEGKAPMGERKWYLDTSLKSPFLVHCMRINKPQGVTSAKQYLQRLLDMSANNALVCQQLGTLSVDLQSEGRRQKVSIPLESSLRVGFTFYHNKPTASQLIGQSKVGGALMQMLIREELEKKDSWKKYLSQEGSRHLISCIEQRILEQSIVPVGVTQKKTSFL